MWLQVAAGGLEKCSRKLENSKSTPTHCKGCQPIIVSVCLSKIESCNKVSSDPISAINACMCVHIH